MTSDEADRRSMVTYFPWGLLVIGDPRSSEEIPEEKSDAFVEAMRTCLVVAVEHEVEGPVCINASVGAEPVKPKGELDWEGSIEVGSGLLRFSDVEELDCLTFRVAPQIYRVRICSDRPVDPTKLDVFVW